MTPATQSRVWRLAPLSELASISHGFAFKGEFFSEYGRDALTTPGNFFESGGFRHLGTKQRYYTADFPESYRLKSGDLIVAMTEQAEGLLGSAAIVPREGHWLHNQRVGRVHIKSGEVSTQYLFHVFNSFPFRKSVAETAAGTKVKHTSPSRLGSIDTLVPSRSEQGRIVEKLDDFDTIVSKLESLIAKKRAIGLGVMQQLLAGVTRLAGSTAMWRRCCISELLRPRSERNTLAEDLTVLTCTKHMGFVRSTDYFKNQVYSRDRTGYRVIYRGDIGYPANHVEEGSIGVQELESRALVSPIYVVMEPRPDVDSYFLQRLLKLDAYRQQFSQATNASVDRRGSLRWPEFARIEVSVPDIEEQRRISGVLRDSELEIAKLERRLGVARDLKLGSAQVLLTGRTRLSVPEGTP